MESPPASTTKRCFKNLSRVTQTISISSFRSASADYKEHTHTTTHHNQSYPSTSSRSAHPSVLRGSNHPVTQFPKPGRWVTRAGNTDSKTNTSSSSSSSNSITTTTTTTNSSSSNAARERSRVRTLRSAFMDLQRSLPAVPQDTKLSKLDVLLLATAYIAQLSAALAWTEDSSHLSLQDKSKEKDDRNFPQKPKQSRNKAITLEKHHHRHHHHNICNASTYTSLSPMLAQSHCRSRHLGMSDDSSRPIATVREGRGPSTCCADRQDKSQSHHYSSGLQGFFHPVKKWPMRTRLYAGLMASASGVKMKRTMSDVSVD